MQEQASPTSTTEDGRYRLLVDAITDYAIYMLDIDGHVVSWNPGATRFKGYSVAEILGRHLSTFYTDEDREAGLPGIALATASREGRFEGEGWRVRKDGTRIWVNAVMDAIRTPDGELVGFAKITRDLTDKKRAEEDLRHSQEQFRLLVEGVTDYAIFMIDLDGFVTTWNAGAERIKGYAPDDIIGQHFSRFYTPEDRAALEPQRALSTALRDGRFEKEGIRLRKDGSHFWASVVIDPVRDGSGAAIGFAKITRDITERLATQRKLDETREALFQAQKLEAVGQLTGGVAHDFNNLLMVILSALSLIAKRIPEDPSLSRLLDNARQAAERGAALTQRMLAFARRQELKTESVDVAVLLGGMRDLLDSSLGARAELDLRLGLSTPSVMTDPNQLETAILNIAVNARDAMPEGGRVTIDATEQAPPSDLKPGRYVKIAISDSGTGMDDTTLARATEPFFTTKGIGKGTGLGLSMVHGLAEQSGGKLKIVSAAGSGTTVELWLPVATGRTAERPVAEPHPQETPCCALRVLTVDDDALVLMNTVMMLEDLGHSVVEASSGRRALEILAQDPAFDLLITDQAMPGMTGVELAKAVLERKPKLPVLLATGYAEIPDVSLPRLGKPFDQHALAAAIQKATGAATP